MGEGSAADLYTFYRRALRKAWEDGRISADERNLLSELSPGVDTSDLDKLESREYFRHRWKDYNDSPPEYRLSIIDNAIGFDPENDYLWSERSSVLYILGNLDEALEAADRSLSMNSGSSDAWFWKGSVLMKWGRMEDASECFEDALEIDPDHTMAWLMLGWAERAGGRLDKAKACYDRVLDLCPAFPLGYIERGLTAVKAGDLESAQKDLLCALDLDPENERAAEMLRSMGAEIPDEQGVRPTEEEGIAEQAEVPANDARVGTEGEISTVQRPKAIVIEDEAIEGEGIDGNVPKMEGVPAEEGGEKEGAPTSLEVETSVPQAKDEDQGADPTTEVIYKWMRCPHCNDRIPLTSLERPLVISCKSCGAKGKLMR